MKKKRKYNSIFRKKLVDKLKKINNNKIYYQIFEIINTKVNTTINNNGVFFDLNKLDDNTIKILSNIITSNTNSENNSESIIEYIPYSIENLEKIDIIGNRLSNQEKQFLKRNKSNTN